MRYVTVQVLVTAALLGGLGGCLLPERGDDCFKEGRACPTGYLCVAASESRSFCVLGSQGDDVPSADLPDATDPGDAGTGTDADDPADPGCTQPRLVGTYDLTSTFDMVSGLHPAVATVLNLVFGLIQNPTGSLLLLMCGDTPCGAPGGGLCDYLFTDPDNPSLASLATVVTIASAIIDANLSALLADACPAADPAVCANTVQIAGDVGLSLRKFQFRSTMTCTKEADPDGLLAMGDCREVWHTVVLRWTLGKDCDPLDDDQCGAVALSMSAVPGIGNAVAANIEAQLVPGKPGYGLAILKHSLGLKYGALASFAIERIHLPQIFGNGEDGLPAVDSYEDLFGALLGGRACLLQANCCSEFAKTVVAQTGTLPGLTASLIEGACEALIQTGGACLRDLLIGLDATPQSFQVGTPAGAPCPLQDNDQDTRFDGLGTREAPCAWDAQVTLGGSSFNPDAGFWGVRQ